MSLGVGKVLGSLVGPAPIMSGNPTVLVGGKPIVREMSSIASCGHPVMKGAITVRTL